MSAVLRLTAIGSGKVTLPGEPARRARGPGGGRAALSVPFQARSLDRYAGERRDSRPRIVSSRE